MHELSIANNLVEIVLEEKQRRHLPGIRDVLVRLGDLSGVNPEALAFSFETAVMGSELDGCRLTVERVPSLARCDRCHHEFPVDDYAFLCPACESPEVTLLKGQEIELESIIAAQEDHHE